MVCEGISVSFYKHEYMVLRLVDQVKYKLIPKETESGIDIGQLM
jgi:hypothetical protein